MAFSLSFLQASSSSFFAAAVVPLSSPLLARSLTASAAGNMAIPSLKPDFEGWTGLPYSSRKERSVNAG